MREKAYRIVKSGALMLRFFQGDEILEKKSIKRRQTRKKRMTRSEKAKEAAKEKHTGRKYELLGLAFTAFALLTIAGLLGQNVGFVGLAFAKGLRFLFGIGAGIVALVALLIGWQFMSKHRGICVTKRFFGFTGCFSFLLALYHHIMIPAGEEILPSSLSAGGGLVGGMILLFLHRCFGSEGSVIVLAASIIGFILLATTWSLSKSLLRTQAEAERGVEAVSTAANFTAGRIKNAGEGVCEKIHQQFDAHRLKKASFYNQDEDESFSDDVSEQKENFSNAITEQKNPEEISDNIKFESEKTQDDLIDFPIDFGRSKVEQQLDSSNAEPEAESASILHDSPKYSTLTPPGNITAAFPDEDTPEHPPVNEKTTAEKRPYILPKIKEILQKSTKKQSAALEMEIQEKARILSQTLEDFHVKAKISNACHGPAVTRYELEPAPGVKVSKITNLADDLALSLAASSVRIEPIPGKAAIGIEVPNQELEGVRLREVLEDEKFLNAKSKLTAGLGIDIGGQAIFADLAKMPHLLVAGATGSGKSVCINTLICSILFKARPDEVKFILIDPKMVELSNYNGIPHLMVPVVTQAKRAASVLNWAVQEMEKRYAKFAEHNVRNMNTYNAHFPEDKMPAIVIIIDELADLMMVAPHDVEDAICRLAQKARAAGIHMVLATQRPSVDVITGIIKANIPSRISFAVSSQIDSRTILDCAGAEKLLGKGDMLFSPIGSNKPIRVQGAFISDEEVENLLSFIRSQGQECQPDEEIVAFTERDMQDDDDAKKEHKPKIDSLLKEAVDCVESTGVASTSSLQRRFGIGYNRAARLIDTMADLRIIGPSNGSKPREILMNQEAAHNALQDLMQTSEDMA
jgi:S-DNA-T family DNA segregation ATPase FtsK/SpoIIIE